MDNLLPENHEQDELELTSSYLDFPNRLFSTLSQVATGMQTEDKFHTHIHVQVDFGFDHENYY